MGQADRKETLMGVRVKDVGESEGRPVMGRIGIEGQADIISARKGADFRRVSGCKRVWRTFLGRHRQMTAMTVVMTGAASGFDVTWHSIDWAKAHRQVRRLQMRIAKAVRDKRWNKVEALQWLLTHSFSVSASPIPSCLVDAVCASPSVELRQDWTAKWTSL